MEKKLREMLEDLGDYDSIEAIELDEILEGSIEMYKDGPEFILCQICRYSDGKRCLKEESMANASNPGDELYLNVCKGFSSVPVPISPAKFKKLMIQIRDANPPEPDAGFDPYLVQRYNMDHLMAQVLMQLGYGDGVKIFLEKSYECPF